MGLTLSLLLLVASDGAAQVDSAAVAEPDPKSMSQKEIREFNSKLSRDHPFYIRCVKSEETGSLARKTYSCRTNRQWTLAYDTGNQNARDAADAMTSKATVTN